jgi:hypothetical protein
MVDRLQICAGKSRVFLPFASYGLTIEGFIERQEIVVSQDWHQFGLSLAHRKIHPPAYLELEDSLLSMIPPIFLRLLQEAKVSWHWWFLLLLRLDQNLILMQ